MKGDLFSSTIVHKLPSMITSNISSSDHKQVFRQEHGSATSSPMTDRSTESYQFQKCENSVKMNTHIFLCLKMILNFFAKEFDNYFMKTTFRIQIITNDRTFLSLNLKHKYFQMRTLYWLPFPSHTCLVTLSSEYHVIGIRKH